MANLALYFRGYQFEHGLKMLEMGYKAARNSLDGEIERIEAQAAAYSEALDNGGEWIGECDEEGHLLWEQSKIYEVQISDVHSALFEVRKAFVIALYHYWEDSVAGWMGLKDKQVTHDKLARYCATEGYDPSPDLGAVRCLANHLKHGRNSGKDWLARLRDEHPSFLPQSPTLIFGLSEDTLSKVAATILASGPTTENR